MLFDHVRRRIEARRQLRDAFNLGGVSVGRPQRGRLKEAFGRDEELFALLRRGPHDQVRAVR